MKHARQTSLPVLVLGAGRMAQRIARVLQDDGRLAANMASRDAEALNGLHGFNRLAPLTGTLQEALSASCRGHSAVILADPTLPAPDVARAALEAGTHYLDITESATSGAAIARMAQDAVRADLCLAPGCGLAPGYVTSLAAEALDRAAPADQITVFVGVLPTEPLNRLGYANIWGFEGLVSEYTGPCSALRNGVPVKLAPLTEGEDIYLNGDRFEAFTTAGSLDALVRTSEGRVAELVFKTLRYPGHLDYIRFMLDDLGLSRRIYQFRTLLTTALPRIEEDMVLIAIRHRSLGQERWDTRILTAGRDPEGRIVSAVSTATAAHVCATLDLILSGRTEPGLISPGQLRPSILRQSPFLGLVASGAASAHPQAALQ